MELTDILFFIGRIIFGGYFFLNGISHLLKFEEMGAFAALKGVPFARAAVVISGLLIFFGGLGIILGTYIYTAVYLIVIFLVPVTIKMHDFWNASDPKERIGEKIHFYKNLALLGAALIILAIPRPWPYSL